MSNSSTVDLSQAIKIHQCMTEYRDTAYLRMMRQMNERAKEILKDDLGSQFVMNCGRDLAGELVRCFFDTSDYYITVDQMFYRIKNFDYENEYDPIANNEDIRKKVYNYNDLHSSTLDSISQDLDNSQTALFTIDRKNDKTDQKARKVYRESQLDENGDLYDDLTGRKGDQTTIYRNGKEETRSDLHADHIQSREAATYNEKYIKAQGVEELRQFINSSDNMQLMHASANTSKGDVRVCNVDGKIVYLNTKSSDYDPKTDITYKATPEQLAEATCAMWEKENEPAKTQKLKETGYLNEDGKVPKSVKKKLIDNIRHSQNEESKIILKNTAYGKVAKDAASYTVDAFSKILIGQIVYYAAPPLIFEIKSMLKDKRNTLDSVLDRLVEAGKRIGNYVLSHLKDIFKNLGENCLKKFIKSFFDILIGTVKATVKKILKLAKNLVMSTCDAIKIIFTPGASAAEKADAVFNLYGVTITNFVVEILFELLEKGAHIPKFILTPLQILASVVCTNLTMLILQKADLFDVRFGFKMNNLRVMFEEERASYMEDVSAAAQFSQDIINQIIETAREDCLNIYHDLEKFDPHTQSARSSLQKVSDMFHMNIEFENEWLNFLEIESPLYVNS